MRNGVNWGIDPEKRLESRNRLHYNKSDSERIELVLSVGSNRPEGGETAGWRRH